jgi:arylsulfatase A-like enzyme
MAPRIAALVVVGLSLLLSHAHGAEAKRPNVLVIYSDDQSYKTLSCYPEAFPFVQTPNIDALASSGVRFHGAYLGSWCMPSRTTMLTGRLPHGAESMSMEGVYPGSTYDPKQCPFWPAQARQQGYQTVQIGKWHTGTDSGWGRDWDHQIVWNRPLHPDNAGAYYEQQIMSVDGVEMTIQGYPADNYTRWACEFIKGDKRDAAKPWYLWLCYGSVHGPSKPAARHLGRYKEAEVPLPADIFPPRPGKPAYLEKTQAWLRGEDGQPYAGKNSAEAVGGDEGKKRKSFADWVRQVNECVPAIDEGVGEVIAALKASGQLDDTLIIYTADQGFAMGEHGFRAKVAPYDANYRSPLIVSMPKRFPSGQVCQTPVNGADLVATILSLTGVKVPWALHGRDLTPLLEQPALAWPHACVYEHTGQTYGRATKELLTHNPSKGGDKNFPPYVSILLGGYKLIHYLERQHGEELYDMKADPDELHNLIAEPSQAERVKTLRTALKAELERTQAPFADGLFGAAVGG